MTIIAIIMGLMLGIICGAIVWYGSLFVWWKVWGEEAHRKEVKRLRKRYGPFAITSIYW